jgi:uncharacterized damage-inducible protein DinB
MEQTLTVNLASKIDEQVERTDHLIGLLTADQLNWRPPISDAWSIGELLGHMLDCLAGFCAVLYTAEPQRLAHFASLRDLRVNHDCGREEARDRIATYRAHIGEGFALITDADLGRKIPTVFVPEGETVLTLLLGNLEHLTNHKYQLFLFLKLMGVSVGSADLYHFRGTPVATK